jgi:hypothetical protein
MDGIIICDRNRKETQECFIPVFPGVFMPGKSMPGKVKTRKTPDSADELWIAPRQPSQQQPRIYEPVAGSRLNRYLEFADIALGVKEPAVHKKKRVRQESPDSEKLGSKAVSIHHNGARRGLGAFRNSR